MQTQFDICKNVYNQLLDMSIQKLPFNEKVQIL